MFKKILQIFKNKSLFKDEPCIYYNKRQFINSYFGGFLSLIVFVIFFYFLYTESKDAIRHKNYEYISNIFLQNQKDVYINTNDIPVMVGLPLLQQNKTFAVTFQYFENSNGVLKEKHLEKCIDQPDNVFKRNNIQMKDFYLCLPQNIQVESKQFQRIRFLFMSIKERSDFYNNPTQINTRQLFLYKVNVLIKLINIHDPSDFYNPIKKDLMRLEFYLKKQKKFVQQEQFRPFSYRTKYNYGLIQGDYSINGIEMTPSKENYIWEDVEDRVLFNYVIPDTQFAQFNLQLMNERISYERKYETLLEIVIRIKVQLSIIMGIFRKFCHKYHRNLQFMETAAKINHKKVNLPIYKYFSTEPFWSVLDHDKAKKLYDMFDINQIFFKIFFSVKNLNYQLNSLQKRYHNMRNFYFIFRKNSNKVRQENVIQPYFTKYYIQFQKNVSLHLKFLKKDQYQPIQTYFDKKFDNQLRNEKFQQYLQKIENLQNQNYNIEEIYDFRTRKLFIQFMKTQYSQQQHIIQNSDNKNNDQKRESNFIKFLNNENF